MVSKGPRIKTEDAGNQIVDYSPFDQARSYQKATDGEKPVYRYRTDPDGTLKYRTQWILNTRKWLSYKAMPIKNGPSEEYSYRSEVVVATAIVCDQWFRRVAQNSSINPGKYSYQH